LGLLGFTANLDILQLKLRIEAMKPEKLISRHPLANGLSLEFWDLSRSMVGDRWLVILEVRIALPLNAGTLPPDLLAEEAEISRALGPEIVFTQRNERNFIDASEFRETLKEMETRLLTLAPTYFGHPEFAGRLIRKRYAEYRQKQIWQTAQTQQ
jgi:hypothetical protein